ISQTESWPVVPSRQRMSAKPSPLTSRCPTIAEPVGAEPGEPPPTTAVPFISQTTTCPVIAFDQTMSLSCSPLRSCVAVSAIDACSRPILLALNSVNQRLPSDPTAMPNGPLSAVRIGYSLNTPAVVMRPILLLLNSVNHSAPSGPTVMPSGPLDAVGIG